MTQLRLLWQRGIQIGLICGLVGLLVVLVGMVVTFGQRHVINDIISIGHTLFLSTMLLAGYLAAQRATGATRSTLLLNSLLAGLVSGVPLAVLVLVGNLNTVQLGGGGPLVDTVNGLLSQINLRLIFPNASPGLYEMLTFGQGPLLGSILLLGAGAALGALAGLFYMLPNLLRQVLAMSLGGVLLVSLVQDLLRSVIAAWGFLGDYINPWFFGSKGLTIQGAVTVFLLIAVVIYVRAKQGAQIQTQYRDLRPTAQRGLKLVGWLILAIVLIILPQVLGLFLSEVMTIVGLYILAGLGLNIVVGYAGLLDLGYVAFYAIGAYTVAVLTSPELGFASLSFWQAVPVAIVMGVLWGIILGIPVLKMRGDYLAIVTLGFGEIIRLLVLSDFLRPWLGGASGIGLIPKPWVGGFELAGPQQIYYLIIVGCLIVGFIAWRLKDSRLGRAWKAMREDEDVAEATGINLVSTKLLAFATGAAFSALAGSIFASKLGSVYPHSFNLMYSIYVLCLVIVGGMGSIPGVIVGAFAVVGLPELLREVAEYRLLVYGVVLVGLMLLRPEGLWPEAMHSRELREEEKAESGPASETAAVPSACE